ncbi:MAG: mechanosensitive ion channel [Acidobacteria bacterium]|nr:mechanosensitive ion channel [Acidobacteriota bacterium]
MILSFGAFGSLLFAQTADSSGDGSEPISESPTPTPTPAPTPVPVGDIVSQAETTAERLGKIQGALDQTPDIAAIENELPRLRKQLDSRAAQSSKLLEDKPSLETLRTIEQEWNGFVKDVPAWKADLTSRIATLDGYVSELENLNEKWEKTLGALTSQGNGARNSNTNSDGNVIDIPKVVLQTIRSTIASIVSTRKLVEEERAKLLTLQTKVSKEETRINETLNSIKQVRQEALSHLLVRDSPPIWVFEQKDSTFIGYFGQIKASLSEQFGTLQTYAYRDRENFLVHGLLIVILAGLLFWLRGKLRPWVEKEPKLARAFTVFELPIASALILTVIFSGQLYPQAPRILTTIIGGTALIPGIIFLRRILDPPMFPILNALMVFYFVDRLREITSALPFVSRILFLLEIIGAVIFLIWFLRSKRLSDRIQVKHHRIFSLIKKVIPVALVLFSVACVANIFGFVSLSLVIGNGIFRTAYAALLLYVIVQIIESLLTFAFRVRPLSLLNMVKEHRRTLQYKVFRIIQWLAIIIWGFVALQIFSISDTVIKYATDVLTAQLTVGSIAISISDLILFGVTVWLAFAISRAVRFVLEEDVYSRLNLGGGVPYATSTILHYSILVIGFILAIAALGIDLTKFTILAGAFGVGLGFGMQNIVNNFVSGLILLFERPVKVDDFVQIGTHQGDLKQIGLRASVLRTVDGSEIIVPNGQLISEEVTNWTLSDSQRRIEINVGVAYGSDPRQVMELLTSVAIEHDEILKEPAPRAIFVGFGDNSLDFQLRAWTDSDNWVVVSSDLTLGVHDKLYEAEIEIPFPQRDLHVRGVDRQLLGRLKEMQDRSDSTP